MESALRAIPSIAILLAAAVASADSVEVTYEIQPGLSTPAIGGTYTIRFTALDVNTLLPGPSTLVSFAPTQSFATYGLVGVPGTYPVDRVTLTASGGQTAALSVGTALTGDLQQLGTIMITTFTFGYVVTVPTGTGRDDFAVWRTPGRLDFTFQAYAPPYPTFGQRARFGSQEVSRTFMPEPPGEWVLPSSAMILGLLGWRRRRH